METVKQQDILVVDDEPNIRGLVKEILEDEGYVVRTAGNANEAREVLAKQKPDLMLLDIWMPGEDGISLLKTCDTSEDDELSVIIMSGHGTIETAMEAMRCGADHFIEKPLTMAKLLQCVRKVLNKDAAEPSATQTYGIVGSSLEANVLRETATRLAATDESVLVHGATGVGKRTFAEWIHACRTQSKGAFVSMEFNVADTKGKSTRILVEKLSSAIDKARDGTLFIRHIEHLSDTAMHLLKDIPTDIRLMASCYTPNDVLSLFPAERKPTVIEIPKLKQRIDDLPELLRTGVDFVCQNEGAPYRRFSIAAQNRLLNYDWPENLRELDNMVRKLLSSSEQTEISLEEVEDLLTARSPMASRWFKMLLAYPLREAREQFEKAYLENALREVDGNVSLLAEKTGMERRHLYRKLKALSVDSGRKQ